MKIRVKIHWSQLFDFDDPNTLRAFMRSLPAGSIAAGATFYQLSSVSLILAGLAAIMAFVVMEVVAACVVLWMASAGTSAAMGFVAPSGSSTPSPDDYSYEKSLLARGQLEQALTELKARMLARPDDPALCLFAADVHMREARDPATAEQLYLRVREMPAATNAQDYAATNRLIDLYMGPLDNPARAAAELERMRTRHPGTTAAAHAGKALQQLR